MSLDRGILARRPNLGARRELSAAHFARPLGGAKLSRIGNQWDRCGAYYVNPIE